MTQASRIKQMKFAIGDTFLAYRSESLRISLRLPERRLSFRMDGFIFCAERLMDQLMFYQCPRPLRKRAALAIRMNDATRRFDSYFDACQPHHYNKLWRAGQGLF